MPLKLLDVIWTYDEFIKPPGPKMVVCVEVKLGYFYRINSEDKWQRGVELLQNDNPTFLTKDCFLECGNPCEIDEYLIEKSISSKGILGSLNLIHIPKICAAIKGYGRISDQYRKTILAALEAV